METVLRRVEEEALGDATEVTAEGRDEYWRLHKALSAKSSIPPKYMDACQTLNLDPRSPIPDGGAPYALKPWQVQAMAWAIEVEKVLPGILLADSMGLGKTLTAPFRT